jgi:ferredoxin-NADP reductase
MEPMYFLNNLSRLVGPLLVPSRFPDIIAQSFGMLGTKQLRLVEQRPEGAGTTTFRFEPQRAVDWKAGQHFLYRLPHEHPDAKGAWRFFTIASAPHEQYVQVTTRTADPISSFKQALLALQPGATVSVRGPLGIFTVPDGDRPRIFIAGGVGITPVRSIFLDLDHRRQPFDATLFYANSTPEFIFRKELDAVAERHDRLTIDYVVSPRRVSVEDIRKAPQFERDPMFYVTGSGGMVQHYYRLLRSMGVPRRRIRRDVLIGY